MNWDLLQLIRRQLTGWLLF